MPAGHLEAYQIGDASNAEFTAAEAKTVLPPINGDKAKFFLLTTNADVHFLVGTSTITATTAIGALLSASTTVVINAAGCSHLSHIGHTGTGTLGITPLANE